MSLQKELLRKLIHLGILLWVVILIYVPYHYTIIIFSALLLTALVMEQLRKTHSLNKFFNFLKLNTLLRIHEQYGRWMGVTYVALAAWLLAVFFSREISITALMILVFSDTAAALIGKKWGKPNQHNKSWLGTSAFIGVGIIAVLCTGLAFSFTLYQMLIGVLAVIVAAFVERWCAAWKGDDNLWIPLSAAIVMWIGM